MCEFVSDWNKISNFGAQNHAGPHGQTPVETVEGMRYI